MEVEPRRSCFTANSENLNKFINSYISKTIWEHQIKAVKDIREYFANPANYRIGICVLPTGAGKSGIAVMSTYACSAKRVLVITPSKHISKQMFINFCGENSQSYFVRRKIVSEQNFEALRPICKQVVENTENINSYFNDEIVIANAHKFGSKSRVEIDKIPYDKIDFVIVDEAHHYPADTWQLIIKHFPNAKKLFLTATPKNGENDILPDQSEHICFKMERNELVHKGIIRDVDFNDDSNSTDHQSACIAIGKKVKATLLEHDHNDDSNFHQAMVLCQTIDDLNSVNEFVRIYNDGIANDREKCHKFIGNTHQRVLDSFKNLKFRTLVICGSLLEGFDHPNVSVVGIARNVHAPVIFAQFIGRSFRKLSINDPVNACIVTDKFYNQRTMWEKFETLPTSYDEPETTVEIEIEENSFQPFVSTFATSNENLSDSD